MTNETSQDELDACEVEKTPEGTLCECGCEQWFTDHDEHIDHLEAVVSIQRCEAIGRDKLIRKMEGKLAALARLRQIAARTGRTLYEAAQEPRE